MRKIYYPVIIIFILLQACSSVPRFTSQKPEPQTISTEIIKDLPDADNDKVLETEIGVASFYADKYNGRITYNGEVYDMNGVSAAHPSYQMGTVLRITNLENGKIIMLKVNDRMPKHPDRIIDLSLGAAKALGFVNQGLARVKIEVLKWGDGKK